MISGRKRRTDNDNITIKLARFRWFLSIGAFITLLTSIALLLWHEHIIIDGIPNHPFFSELTRAKIRSSTDIWYDDPSSEKPKPRAPLPNRHTNRQSLTRLVFPRVTYSSIKLEQLSQHELQHGTFFFGPHSQHVQINSNYEPQWTSIQKEMIHDNYNDTIDFKKEKERCDRYNFDLNLKSPLKRRRLFLGAMIASESMTVLEAVGTEAYNIFHTVSFVEGNVTQNGSPRKWKYYDPEVPPDDLNKLYQLFGPKTKVSVDYYLNNFTKNADGMMREWLQREGITYRWARNGMREDDIGIMSDADETFSRDFLRAMQICDVPQFRPGQNCYKPKLLSSTMVMESSPNCITKGRRWHHPDAMLGECIEQVGSLSLHPPTKREWNDRHGQRKEGYGKNFNYSLYIIEGLGFNNTYPLWAASDVRENSGGNMANMADGSPTGYHFHNFYESYEDICFKYRTYGHANKHAMTIPLGGLSNDLRRAVNCAKGVGNESLNFDNSGSSVLPIYFTNEEFRNKRHQLWQSIVVDEEELHNGNVTS